MKLRLIFFLSTYLLWFSGYSQKPAKGTNKSQKPVYELLSPKEFQAKMKTEPGVLLDVRTASEQKKGMLAGATAMDIFADNFETSIDKLDKNKTYYVYCAAGGRSLEACELMQKKGFKHVVDLDGGITKWKSAGLPVSN